MLYNYGTDAFDVYFLNNSKKLVKKVEEVYLDNLVDVIDWYVEKDNSFDYDQRVKRQYSISYYKWISVDFQPVRIRTDREIYFNIVELINT